MARGGKREGAGRKPGSATRRTREIANAIAETGLTPLDYMLGILRDEDADASARFEAAKQAAPYCHARLAAVDVAAKVGALTEADLKWLGDGS